MALTSYVLQKAGYSDKAKLVYADLKRQSNFKGMLFFVCLYNNKACIFILIFWIWNESARIWIFKYPKLKNCYLFLGQYLFWQNNGNQVYKQKLSWQSPNPRARPIDIETSAYALLYLAEKKDMSQGIKIVNWLVSQRNPQGGFSSTQVQLDAQDVHKQLVFISLIITQTPESCSFEHDLT